MNRLCCTDPSNNMGELKLTVSQCCVPYISVYIYTFLHKRFCTWLILDSTLSLWSDPHMRLVKLKVCSDSGKKLSREILEPWYIQGQGMITPICILKAATPSTISVFSATLLQVMQTPPIHTMAVSQLHFTSYLSAALLQTHPVPLSASGKNQVGQSPWLAVVGPMKFMKTISCARQTEFIAFCILKK